MDKKEALSRAAHTLKQAGLRPELASLGRDGVAIIISNARLEDFGYNRSGQIQSEEETEVPNVPN